MKKAILLLQVMVCCVLAHAQTTVNNYTDGLIWFRVTQDVIVRPPANGHEKIALDKLPFIQQLNSQVPVAALTMPFLAARTSAPLQRTYQLQLANGGQTTQALAWLKQSGMVEYAERVPVMQKFLTPNDPSFGAQYALSLVNAPAAWNLFSAGSNVVIAIVDDAIQYNHSDLSANIWRNTAETPSNNIDDDGNGYIDDVVGYDVANNDGDPSPPGSSFDHGTPVAGMASAVTNNSTGVAGMGFSCKLMCIKATADQASGSTITNGYEGIVYAAAQHADIINLSWGGDVYSNTGQSVIDYAVSQGCILVGAAGNSNVNTVFYPAGYNGVLSVAATNSSDQKASFSNYGNWVDIAAPGNNVYTTKIGNAYGYFNGTSFASPLVAGLLGLMKSLNPTLPNADLINCLTSTATNINAQNPSYTGQLGAGRINALAAMQCINATLLLPPVADFTVNNTTVTAGGRLTFTNQSTYNPTSWVWSFPGGTPATYNGQTPPQITYSTAGTYNVSLTVSNNNGTDTETKTAYINVQPAVGCLSVNFPTPSGWTYSNYFTGVNGADGWINGVNVYLDKQKAMYFDQSATPYTHLEQAYIAFGVAGTANPGKLVPVRVYDGTSGTPGALLGTSLLTMGGIVSDAQNAVYTAAVFEPALTLPASKKFFVSIDLTNLTWSSGTKDTLSIVSNTNGQTTPSAIWEQQSNNVWYQYGTAGSWSLNASLLIHPFLTSQPSVAVITPSATSICAGQTISFNSTGSTAQDTLLWYLEGSTNVVIPTSPNASVIYPSAGSYNAILFTVGGGCNLLKSDTAAIQVNPVPVPAVTISNNDVCTGAMVTLTASGASNYTWSPADGLNVTTGAQVQASPSQTTNYTLLAVNNFGCSNTTTAELRIRQRVTPTLSVTANNTTVCQGDSVTFTAQANNQGNTPAFEWYQNGSSLGINDSVVTLPVTNADQVYAVVNSSYDCVTTTAGISDAVTITVLQHSAGSLAHTMCSNETYNFNQQVLTTSGTYQTVLPAGNGCDSTVTLQLTVLPTVPLTSLTAAICSGDSYVFGAANLQTGGIYYDTLSNINGCDSVLQLTLTENPLPVPVIIQQGAALSVQAFNSYQWLQDGTPVNGATAGSFTVQSTGSYSVVVTDSAGCTDTSQAVLVTISGIEDITGNKLVVYPNPTTGKVILQLQGAPYSVDNIEVANPLGQVLGKVPVLPSGNNYMVDLSTYATGVYLLRIHAGSNSIISRVVVTHP